MPLQIELQDIYFIIGLSQRGEEVDLKGKARGGLNNIVNYIVVYCAL